MSRMSQLDFAARNRARNAENRARRDQERQFQQQQMLARQQADAAQQQAILQANLSAMQAGGMAYQQDQMRRQAEQRFAAGSTGRKNDARAAAVFQDNLRRDAGREQARIASGAMDQQAGIQSQRDSALHGYGQSDARLAQRFNQANALQQHGYNLESGRIAQGYNQDNALQQHVYNLESDRIAQGYNQDNERLRHGFQNDLKQRGFDLQQRGADAQQMRGQEDARFSNQMKRGNSYDQMTQEKLNKGWTYRPEDKIELDKLRKEQNSLPGKVRSHVITSKEAARQYELLEDEMRYFQPDVPPPRVDLEQEFNQGTYERNGVLYNKAGDKGWSVLHDPSLAQQGRGSSTATGSYDPQTGRPVRAEANKLYSDLRKNWMDHKREAEAASYGDDGQRLANAPKAMTWEEFLRSENSQRPDDDIKLMYPELFQESAPAAVGAGTPPPAMQSAPASNRLWNPIDNSGPRPSDARNLGVPDWEFGNWMDEHGAPPDLHSPQNRQLMYGDPKQQEQMPGMLSPPASAAGVTAAALEFIEANKKQSEETKQSLKNLDAIPYVQEAKKKNPESAGPIIEELRTALTELVRLTGQGKPAPPTLQQKLIDLRSQLQAVPEAPPVARPAQMPTLSPGVPSSSGYGAPITLFPQQSTPPIGLF